MGSSIDMAVQQAAYVCLIMLQDDYYYCDNSHFRHIPRGYITSDGAHFTRYDNLEVYDDDSSRMDVTS